jgi:hypothetical protein
MDQRIGCNFIILVLFLDKVKAARVLASDSCLFDRVHTPFFLFL